jgi:hypothetical protein
MILLDSKGFELLCSARKALKHFNYISVGEIDLECVTGFGICCFDIVWLNDAFCLPGFTCLS